MLQGELRSDNQVMCARIRSLWLLRCQELAEDGYAVLAERLREAPERAVVADALCKILNVRVRLLLNIHTFIPNTPYTLNLA